MLRKLQKHLSFANVVSMMALFVALSGVAWAASLPKNSVGAAQIKTDAVSRSEIKRSGVSTAELKDGGVGAIDVTDASLTGADIGDGTLALADLGASSVDGSKVADGSLAAGDVAAGTFLGGKVTVQTTQSADIPDGGKLSVDAHCPTGQTATGGGARGDDTDSEQTELTSSRPIISTTNGAAPLDNGTFTGWRATAINKAGGTAAGLRVEVWVVCATLP